VSFNIAIIGAGLSGAILYDQLKKFNFNITLFEKSRGCGGRCSTRYIKELKINHGTSYFTTQDEGFEKFCEKQLQHNILAKEGSYYYAIDGINKMVSTLIDPADLLLKTKITQITKKSKKWLLYDEEKNIYSNFDIVFFTIPAPQVLELQIDPLPKAFTQKLKSVTYNSVGSLLAYGGSLDEEKINFLQKSDFFKKIFIQKDGIVFHINYEISNQLENKEDIQQLVIDEVRNTAGIQLQKNFTLISHLWKYAFVDKNLQDQYLYDPKHQIGFCGDYFVQKDLESSYHSSASLAQSL
jgi:predicted NAD/FAD-dependent oxidoreductase